MTHRIETIEAYAVIPVYDAAGNVSESHERTGDSSDANRLSKSVRDQPIDGESGIGRHRNHSAPLHGEPFSGDRRERLLEAGLINFLKQTQSNSP